MMSQPDGLSRDSMITQRLAWHARSILETPFQGQSIIVLKSRELQSSVYDTVFGGLHDKFPRLRPCVEFGEYLLEILPIF